MPLQDTGPQILEALPPDTKINTTIITNDPDSDANDSPDVLHYVEYEELEYPEPDIPSSKPYFPIDGPAKENSSKAPRFEKTFATNSNFTPENEIKLINILNSNKVQNVQNRKQENVPLIHFIPQIVNPIGVLLSNKTQVELDEINLELDDMMYGSAGQHVNKEKCTCHCDETHHEKDHKDKTSNSRPKIYSKSFDAKVEIEGEELGMVLKVSGGSKNGQRFEGTTYFPVKDDEGLTTSPTFFTTTRPDISEAVDLSVDPNIFFQVIFLYILNNSLIR